MIYFKGRKLVRLSAMSHIELYIFPDDERSLECYRVYFVSEEFNRKFQMYEATDEYDMRTLARELSAFMAVPLMEHKADESSKGFKPVSVCNDAT